MSFCVYSGNGVAKLRSFLTELFNTITEDMQGDDEETEYDDDFDESFVEVPHDVDMETGNEGDLDDDFMHDGRFHFQPSSSIRDRRMEPIVTPRHPSIAVQHNSTLSGNSVALFFAETSATYTTADQVLHNPQPTVETTGTAQRSQRGFGLHPVVETQTSPVPSDVASNRSGGTTQSNGTGFFRTYPEFASSSRSNGAITPDYNYAEIGHGRGAGSPLSYLPPVFGNHAFTPIATLHGTPHGITQVMHSAGPSLEMSHGQGQSLPVPLAVPDRPTWPLQEPPTPVATPTGNSNSLSNTPTFNVSSDPREPEGRSVRRSLRSTINAAEHYATSLLFGRSSTSGSNNLHDSGSGSGAKGPY